MEITINTQLDTPEQIKIALKLLHQICEVDGVDERYVSLPLPAPAAPPRLVHSTPKKGLPVPEVPSVLSTTKTSLVPIVPTVPVEVQTNQTPGVLTLDNLKITARYLFDLGGREHMVKLLKSYKIESICDLPTEQYGSMLAEIENQIDLLQREQMFPNQKPYTKGDQNGN
jgi:hypothetical protein